MEIRNYEHITDCVNHLLECKTIEEVHQVMDNFPRWSGEWWVDTVEGPNGKYYEVSNQYYDKQYDDLIVEAYELEIPVIEDGEE